ncbi:helix-turn-helix domain-containing protein [Streptomyces auratus AGR0001]|uniref:Helix-turn-helix domain-containing protein n=1 Tax=Streptomyces auratus AGR0001 TaxID=1160718 RepID=A0A8B1NIG0_9ACTN|nr:helix-turn-helix domain-containing protein [Streptomyces auratus AGR0001]
MSRGQWLTQQRADLARQLLERRDLPVNRVAERVGFGTGATLRHRLHAAIGVSPGAYRRTFQTSMPDTPVHDPLVGHRPFMTSRLPRASIAPGPKVPGFPASSRCGTPSRAVTSAVYGHGQ